MRRPGGTSTSPSSTASASEPLASPGFASRHARGSGLALAFGLTLGLAFGLAAPAHAQSPDEIRIAREAANDALQAYKQGDYEHALSLFVQAKAIYPSAQIVRMFGYTHLALEHWQTALDALEEALASKIAPLPEADRKDVEEQIGKALTHFGEVQVTSHAPGAALRMNGGAPTPLPLAKPLRLLEGTYTFTVEAKGRPEVTEELKVEGGKTHELALEPPAPGEPPPPPRPKAKPAAPPPKPSFFQTIERPASAAMMGTGLALGAAALVTGISAASLRAKVVTDVDTHLRVFGEGCARGDRRLCEFDIAVTNYDADRADALRNVTIGLGVGAAVLAGGGAALWMLGGRGEKAPGQRARDERLRAERSAGGSEFVVRCGPYGFVGVSCGGAF